MKPDSSKIVSRRFNVNDRTAIFLLLVLSAVLVAPAAYFGIPENYDLGQHLRFARTWHDAFSSGSLSVSWGSADNAGLGSAGVRFYPPATHMLMGAIQLVTNSWYDTLWLTMLFWMFLGSVGVYKLASEWCSKPTSLYTALLYAIVPYHLLQVFQAFLLAEFAAAAVLPFCFLYAHRLITKGGTANILPFAASYSALVLTHLPSTIIGSLSLAVFAVCFLSRENFLKVAARFVFGFSTALATTAFYWVRMISELQWVKHNTSEYYASGFYNYSTYFFPMLYSAGDDYVPRFLWLMDICIVLTYTLLIPALIVAVRRRLDAPRHVVALLAVAGFVLFMMSIVSAPIWDNVATIQKLQFPFRWLGPASLAAALLFPIGVEILAITQEKITRAFAYSLASILTLVIVFDVTQIVVPSAPLPREEIAKLVAVLDERPGCDCWWPAWARSEAMKSVQKVNAGNRASYIRTWEPTTREFNVADGERQEIQVATFYYPHWRVEINGIVSPVTLGENGTIGLIVPSGNANVRLFFQEPFYVHLTRYISLAAWSIVAFLILCLCFVRQKTYVKHIR